MTGYKVIVTKSTVPVGTGKRLREVIQAHQTVPCEFDIVSNPEFLREGSAIEDFLRPNRIVIGTDSAQATAIMKDLYRPLYLLETPFVITDVPTAEMIKYASNAFLAVKISFINEIANICERTGANVQITAKAMGLDKRIGGKFLHAGPGYGGSCFPKDVSAMIQTGDDVGYDFKIARAASHVNANQRTYMVDKIRDALGDVKGKTLAVLGLSFKPNTDDLRDSPAISISRQLMEEGATIRGYDPAALEEALRILPGLVPCRDAYQAVEGAEALLLLTEWNQFRNLDLDRIKAELRKPVFFDLRNVYEPDRMLELGFDYHSVGRPNRKGKMPE